METTGSTTSKECPILFNAEMVNAILSGRKTQTRRIMKVQPSEHFHPQDIKGAMDFTAHWYTPGVIDKDGYLQPARKDVFGVADEDEGYTCPLGAIGDQLWVREAFATGLCTKSTLAYRATHRPDDLEEGWFEKIKWTPSIHMPRWASRINLLITGVRVERLKTISTGDAMAEGYPAEREATGGPLDAWLWFRDLWDGIYPDNTFEVNPWCWVIEFERMEAK
ncbi:phage-like protein [Yersinia enterocolitica]|uniref:Hypothetical phage related protein n=1 Tax=Yersinia enterocolitica serotype O:8 / biotype 1B (strain NCTC 13174 / 8081) TaxID=393305 RepID=A1JR57_YERE8|nr:phage-like protein [Yersinia enterocolitica]AJJ23173.1 hypothetical protein CH49_1769 [Yersinia enterocolitica]CAL12400.1 hypothetical phage related protein [Yersinia enterocolitica subsp. enterocolitica 8081]HDL8280407.1 hypothetical protein [Yersinia enterocolitica]